MVKARDIETSTTETALGWPVACVDAGDTAVFVRQAPAGAGLVIEICTKTDAEHGCPGRHPGRPPPAPGPAHRDPAPHDLGHPPRALLPARAGACTGTP